MDIILDTEIGRFKDRNLILYGNEDTNRAFDLVSKSGIRVNRNRIEVGGKSFAGEDLAAVYLYPEGKRLIGVVAGTGSKGLRYTDRMPYFTSGVAYPDWAVFRTDALAKGTKGAIAAGFFDNRWNFDDKESAFRD